MWCKFGDVITQNPGPTKPSCSTEWCGSPRISTEPPVEMSVEITSDKLRGGWLNERGAARAEDAQGKPTKSHSSPSIQVYEDNPKIRSTRINEPFCTCVRLKGGRFFFLFNTLKPRVESKKTL